MDRRRDATRGEWWTFDFLDYNTIFVAAVSSLVTALTLLVLAYLFGTSDTSLALMPVNRGAGHKHSSRAVAMQMKKIPANQKVRGHRDPVLTCTGLFVFVGLLLVLTI